MGSNIHLVGASIMNLSRFFYFCSILSAVLVLARTKDLRNIFEEMDVNQNGVVTLQEFKRVLKKVSTDFSAGKWNQNKLSQSLLLLAGQGQRETKPILKTWNTESSSLVNQKSKTQTKRKLGRN